MKYMLLIYNNPRRLESFREDELDAVMGEVDAIMSELDASPASCVGGEALADIRRRRRTVRVRDGVAAVTDGPFVEAKEHLGRLSTSSTATTSERALEIAARMARTRGTARSRCGR